MTDEDILGFHRLLPPFRAKRMDWRHVPRLVHRQGMPPPLLAALPQLTEPLPQRDVQHTEQGVYGYIDPDM
jgi:hypothetical protein